MKSKVVNLTAKFRKAVPGLRALAEEDVSPPMPHWDARAPKSTNDPSATASAVNDGNASFGDHVHPRYMQATVDDAEDEEELGGRGGGGGGVNESAASYQVSGHCGPTGAPELNAEQPSSVLDSFMEKHAANSQDHLDWRERPPPESMRCDECHESPTTGCSNAMTTYMRSGFVLPAPSRCMPERPSIQFVNGTSADGTGARLRYRS